MEITSRLVGSQCFPRYSSSFNVEFPHDVDILFKNY